MRLRLFFYFLLVSIGAGLLPSPANAQPWGIVAKSAVKPPVVLPQVVRQIAREAVLFDVKNLVGQTTLAFSAQQLPLPDMNARIPNLSLQQMSPHEMYRGMSLDGKGADLQHILQQGLELSKSHYTIQYGTYDMKPYPDDTLAIFATTDLSLATEYAVKGAFQKGKKFLPVVFHLKYVGPQNGATRLYSVEIPHDVPPEWIYKVSALLEINGKPRWGELKMGPDNLFFFSPYPLPKEPRF